MHRPSVSISYCTQCNWMLRAAWLAQELLSSFGQDLASVTLVPGTGGIFVVTADGVQIWERKADGGFPDAKALKQRLRDHAWPERDLGHVDRASKPKRDEADLAAATKTEDSPSQSAAKGPEEGQVQTGEVVPQAAGLTPLPRGSAEPDNPAQKVTGQGKPQPGEAEA